MPKACDLKKGEVIQFDNQLYIVKHIDVKSPSSRGAQTLYKTRFSRIPDGQKMEQTLTGDDMLAGAELRRASVQLLFQEGDLYTFMDTEDFSQHIVNQDVLEDALPYLSLDQQNPEILTALIVEDQMIAVELPTTVVMPIVETSPAIKGGSASARTKAARLPSGLEVQVPEYLAEGEKIKINTATGKYISRASE